MRMPQNHLSMETPVTLVHEGTPGSMERSLIKLVEFLGGKATAVSLQPGMSLGSDALAKSIPSNRPLLISARALASTAEYARSNSELRLSLADLSANVLVYGFSPEEHGVGLAQNLSSGWVSGLERVETAGCKISVTGGCRDICGPLSGLDLDGAGNGRRPAFKQGATAPGSCVPLVSIGRNPVFVQVTRDAGRLMLLACDEIADLDAPVPRDTSLMRYLLNLAPVMMFLRSSAPGNFWESPNPVACLVIDDPLLKSRYGFLDYSRLLDLMEQRRFCSSIAFIPWNYRRSDRRQARLFAGGGNRYSICVHGCDHTRGEFGSSDEALLRAKARQALERMARHRDLSGVDFDPVMVFPQGVFSSAAMRALKDCGYLAAVNTMAHPVDENGELTLRDLVDVASTRFSNFPLFTRRYPRQFSELAFDLFLGKPPLLVEHHGFFKNGYEALAETVDRLHQLEGNLRWANLATICSRACRQRIAPDGKVRVQFYTDRFVLQNGTGRRQDYILSRRSLPDERPEACAVDNCPADFLREADCVCLETSLEPGASAEVRRSFAPPAAPAVRPARDPLYEAKVFIRRSLSEFRDNCLDLNPLLRRAARNRQK